MLCDCETNSSTYKARLVKAYVPCNAQNIEVSNSRND
jgi:hypothetical protein